MWYQLRERLKHLHFDGFRQRNVETYQTNRIEFIRFNIQICQEGDLVYKVFLHIHSFILLSIDLTNIILTVQRRIKHKFLIEIFFLKIIICYTTFLWIFRVYYSFFALTYVLSAAHWARIWKSFRRMYISLRENKFEERENLKVYIDHQYAMDSLYDAILCLPN